MRAARNLLKGIERKVEVKLIEEIVTWHIKYPRSLKGLGERSSIRTAGNDLVPTNGGKFFSKCG